MRGQPPVHEMTRSGEGTRPWGEGVQVNAHVVTSPPSPGTRVPSPSQHIPCRPRVLSVEQAAAELALAYNTLSRAIQRGELAVVRYGYRRIVNRGALDSYVAGCRIVPGSGLRRVQREVEARTAQEQHDEAHWAWHRRMVALAQERGPLDL